MFHKAFNNWRVCIFGMVNVSKTNEVIWSHRGFSNDTFLDYSDMLSKDIQGANDTDNGCFFWHSVYQYLLDHALSCIDVKTLPRAKCHCCEIYHVNLHVSTGPSANTAMCCLQRNIWLLTKDGVQRGNSFLKAKTHKVSPLHEIGVMDITSERACVCFIR